MIPQLTKIKAAQPRCNHTLRVAPPAAVIAKNYKQLGMKTPVICSGGVPTKEFGQLVGNTLAGGPWIMFGIKIGRADTMSPDDPWRKNLYDPFQKVLQEKYGKDKEVQDGTQTAMILIRMVIEAIRSLGQMIALP